MRVSTLDANGHFSRPAVGSGVFGNLAKPELSIDELIPDQARSSALFRSLRPPVSWHPAKLAVPGGPSSQREQDPR